MANTCFTTYRVTGSRKAVMDLWTKIDGLKKEERRAWLFRLAEIYGIDYEARRISVRGDVLNAQMEGETSGDCLLSFDTQTAWTACTDLFKAINRKLDGELSISYMEIEPGCEVFYIHDEGNFFPERCYVSAYGGPFGEDCEDVYDTVSDAVDLWCSRTGQKRGERSLEEMVDFINAYEYEEDDVYYYIHEFTME